MGFFDKFIKNVVKDAAGSVIDKNTKQSINNIANFFDKKEQTKTDYDIPSSFSSFPKYPQNITRKPVETSTNKYNRLTIMYDGIPKEEYINTLLLNNYQKANDVRYNKDNTYIIIEKLGNKTKIAFHINK